MLIRESYNSYDLFHLLQNQTYLTEQESKINIAEIPVLENSTYNINFISYHDLNQLSQDYNISLKESMSRIAKTNNIPVELIGIIIDEDMAIQFPHIINEFQCILKPISTYDPVYQEVDFLFNEEKYFKHDNSVFALTALGALGLGLSSLGKSKLNKTKQDIIKNGGTDTGLKDVYERQASGMHMNNIGNLVTKGAVGAGFGKSLNYLYNKSKNEPKSKIAKTIAALRRKYTDVLNKSKLQVDQGQASILRRIATRIAHIIDKLLLAMQNAAN